MKRIGMGLLSFLLVISSGIAQAAIITFDGLVGTNDTQFSSYQESGFVVTAIGGTWYEDHTDGNPAASISIANPNGISFSKIEVTLASVGNFTFNGVDLASNLGSSSTTLANFAIYGHSNGSTVYTVAGSLGKNRFWNITGASFVSTTEVDSLEIWLYRDPSQIVSSMNIDNINVDAVLAPVPEPSTMLLFGSGLVGLVGYGRRKFKK